MFRILTLIILSLFCVQATAQQSFKIAAPISNNMVLQQGKPTSVWGTAESGTVVTVSFAGQSHSVTAADDQWQLQLKPLKVNATPAEMTITAAKDGNKVSKSIKNILVGEVWMCSGQSNMAWTVERVLPNFKEEIESADFPNIRYFNTAAATSETPLNDCGGNWVKVSPKSVKKCSAVGFFFGRKLHKELNVPIGLINSSWGGRPIEAFVSMEKLKAIESAKPLVAEWKQLADRYDAKKAKANFQKAMKLHEEKVAAIKEDIKAGGERPKRMPRRPRMKQFPPKDPSYPSALSNSLIEPWTSYAIAGAIWYQGEANRTRAEQYQDLMPGLIEDWRQRWSDEFPFYIVQLAGYMAETDDPNKADAWAELQNAQTITTRKLPNVGVAIANDIGNAKDIHPRNKKDVGIRLALWPLNKVYGKAVEPYASPLYREHSIHGNEIHVSFDHVGDELKSRNGESLQHFAIAGDDQNFVWAEARLDESKKKVIVSSPQVSQPVAVRYAWSSNPVAANLVNSAGLPASLFRTDDWPLSTAGNYTRLGNNKKTNSQNQKANQNQAERLAKLGFQPMFNGKDLSGWTNAYKHGEAKLVNGEIHLMANKKFFLTTEKKYSNFVFIGQIKLPEGKANSGFMFRCHVEPNRVYGYQAEVDGSDRCWSGGLYDEGRRSWIWPSTQGRSQPEFLKHEGKSKAFFAQDKIKNALKRNDWNTYEIRCEGDKITISVNGVETANFVDTMDAEGHIGIQHHGEKGQTYRFRGLYIKEL